MWRASWSPVVRFLRLLVLATVLTGCAYRAESSLFARGVAAYNAGNWAAAEAAFADAFEFAPDSADLHANLGAARLAAGRYAAAVESFGAALLLDPYHAGAAFNRALARLRLNDTAGAQRDWSHALAVEPSPVQRERMQEIIRAEHARGLVPAAGPAPAAAPAAIVQGPAPAAPAPSTTATQPAAVAPPPPKVLSVAELVSRGVRRALDGDRPGALSDLRAAYALETDSQRRQRIAYVLAAAAGPTPMDYDACAREALAEAPGPPEPSASPGAPAPAAPRVPPPPASPAAAVGPGLFSDDELLGQADRPVREDARTRQAFMDCMRRRGY